jgi:uncharacterized protein (DUF433 family)
MSTEAVATKHIWLDDEGTAWIDQTNTKVVEVALDTLAHGWSPEEIHFQHSHLSLAQIHAALGYYYDHRDQLDATIQAGLERSRSERAKSDDSPVRARLRNLAGKE